MISIRDPKKKEKEEQFERVEEFFARFRNTDGSLVGGINEYAAQDEFKTLLRQKFDELLHQRLPAAPAGGKPRQIDIRDARASFEPQSAVRDYPKLELVLIEPKEGKATIPAARSWRDDVEERLVAVAAAKGIPSREWLATALAPIHDRIAKAKQDLDADTKIAEQSAVFDGLFCSERFLTPATISKDTLWQSRNGTKIQLLI